MKQEHKNGSQEKIHRVRYSVLIDLAELLRGVHSRAKIGLASGADSAVTYCVMQVTNGLKAIVFL